MTTLTVGGFSALTSKIDIIKVVGVACPAPATLTQVAIPGVTGQYQMEATLSIPGLQVGDRLFCGSITVGGTTTQFTKFGYLNNAVEVPNVPIWVSGADSGTDPYVVIPQNNLEDIITVANQTQWVQALVNFSDPSQGTPDYSSITMNLVYLRGFDV